MMDIEKLRAMITKATDSDLSDSGRYFREDYSDLTQCGHGDTGEYRNRRDGQLVELLWNNRTTILAMAEEKMRLTTPRPLAEWHEDHSDVLWHLMPIQEPPFCGTPHDSGWPYHEDDEARLWWTPLPDCNAINGRWEARP